MSLGPGKEAGVLAKEDKPDRPKGIALQIYISQVPKIYKSPYNLYVRSEGANARMVCSTNPLQVYH